jgi:hypothetical protein
MHIIDRGCVNDKEYIMVIPKVRLLQRCLKQNPNSSKKKTHLACVLQSCVFFSHPHLTFSLKGLDFLEERPQHNLLTIYLFSLN